MFSIIICTYNPNLDILQKLLDALLMFNNEIQHEVIIVDNNSSPALKRIEPIQQFLEKKKDSRLIEEITPGLTPARIAGIKNAKYDWLIFFDDDNEPSSDYLINALKVISQNPKVGAWGPGNLEVIYAEGVVETLFLKKIRWLFQQRNYKGTFFDNNVNEGSQFYPFGTGMLIRKDILTEYVKKVEAGNYTLSDRTGKNLSSAGDTQILFTCLKMGYFAGSSNLLKLNHLIEAKKATHSYASKLTFALNSSQLKAYLEVFPEKAFPKKVFTNYDVMQVIFKAIISFKIYKRDYTLRMLLSKKLGEINARIIVDDSHKPILLKLFERIN